MPDAYLDCLPHHILEGHDNPHEAPVRSDITFHTTEGQLLTHKVRLIFPL